MSYTLLSDSWPTARKEHRCIWCGDPIKVGQTYRKEQSIFDGQFQHHKWHKECDEESCEYFAGGHEEFSPYENPRPLIQGVQ